MSEATTQRLKVSREGMVLIKSFEGFRPRAVRAEDGGWVIGYGHTLSAREGASVSEAEAELLLQYDLLPVVKMLNDQAPSLNQHQFDALASFAFSIGTDRFLSSDVASRVSSGALGEAADALIGWPEPTPPEAALRRRAAERALFVADPSHAVTLADLLAAPLPPPEVITPVFEPAPIIAARAAAVATLLGEAVEPEMPSPEPEAAVEPAAPQAAEPAEPEPALEMRAPPELAASFQFQRFSPYAATIVGPLPGLGQAAAAPADLNAHVAIELPEPEAAPDLPPMVDAAPAPLAEVPPVEQEPTPEPVAESAPEPVVSTFPPVAAPVADEPVAPDAPLPTPAVAVEPPALVLTPLTEAEPVSTHRPVWGEQQRVADALDQDALFEDEPVEVAILRHEEVVEPRRFDSALAAFMIMGGVGLASCAASAAAFRQAIEDSSGLNDYTLLGWTLGVIGVVCVVASAANLYPRLFPPKDK
ncbi:MAG: glycoside hydrolase family protein [Brevundimonas sp.]